MDLVSILRRRGARVALWRRVAAATALLSVAAPALAEPARIELYSFKRGSDGAGPRGDFVMDGAGALYGAVYYGGQNNQGLIYRLTPPAAGATQWTEHPLYVFSGGDDGQYALGDLTFGDGGALYGATALGGTAGAGVVYKLTPPLAGDGQWTQTVLYNFTGGDDGAGPRGGLVVDAGGAVYGVTNVGGSSNNGVAFKLTPPPAGGTQWTETVLHTFTGDGDGASPFAGLVADSKGALYGTTNSGGVSGLGAVFKLTPPAAGETRWTESVIYRFKGGADGGYPTARLILDEKGALYGTTNRGGTADNGAAFKLTPPAAGETEWTKTTLYRFKGGDDGNNPLAGLSFGRDGALYGTTAGSWLGTAYKLMPPAAGDGQWTQTVLHHFNARPDGANPYAGLVVGKNGALYGATEVGGAEDSGMAFELRDGAGK